MVLNRGNKTMLIGVAVGAFTLMPLFGLGRLFLSPDPFSVSAIIVSLLVGGIVGLLVAYIGKRSLDAHNETLKDHAKQLSEANEQLSLEIEERKKAEEQLRQSQKIEAIGRLAGGVAHDVNNVLAAIMTVASTMEMEFQRGDTELKRDDVSDILEACKRGRDLTVSLLGFARKGDYSKKPMSLVNAIRNVEKLLGRVIPKTVTFETKIKKDVAQVEGDPSQLMNLLMNLSINAIDAMEGKGKLTVAIDEVNFEQQRHGLPAGRYVKLSVNDTGMGMSKDVIDKAFDPFFTTKSEGKGTGLGLSRVYGTVREHEGALVVDSTIGEGTTMEVYLPALGPTEQDPGAISSVPPMPAFQNNSVLLVEDEPLLRKSGSRLLKQLGYQVITAVDGENAIEMFKENGNQVSIILLDMVMPNMSGEEAFYKIREINPNVPVLICTGYSREDSAKRLLLEDSVGFIQKPFSSGALSEKMLDMLEMKGAEMRA